MRLDLHPPPERRELRGVCGRLSGGTSRPNGCADRVGRGCTVVALKWSWPLQDGNNAFLSPVLFGIQGWRLTNRRIAYAMQRKALSHHGGSVSKERKTVSTWHGRQALDVVVKPPSALLHLRASGIAHFLKNHQVFFLHAVAVTPLTLPCSPEGRLVALGMH